MLYVWWIISIFKITQFDIIALRNEETFWCIVEPVKLNLTDKQPINEFHNIDSKHDKM